MKRGRVLFLLRGRGKRLEKDKGEDEVVLLAECARQEVSNE